LTLDTRTGRVIDVSANNKVVDRSNPTIAANSAIAGIAAGYNNLASPIANLVIGSITADVSNTPAATGEKPAGDLIADAQLAATQAPEFGGAQLTLMNTGGVRASGFVFSQSSGGEPPGDVTYGEAFTVQPFGNALVTMTLTAQQLKDVLEQEFQGCQITGEPIQSLTDRVLQVSNGFKFSWSASTPASTCNKVTDISLNGTDILKSGVFKVPTSTSYRVTVNNFMPRRWLTSLHGTDLLGAPDIDALAAYLASFNAETGHAPYDPNAAALNKPRITLLP
jgi:5'-nucleotidase